MIMICFWTYCNDSVCIVFIYKVFVTLLFSNGFLIINRMIFCWFEIKEWISVISILLTYWYCIIQWDDSFILSFGGFEFGFQLFVCLRLMNERNQNIHFTIMYVYKISGLARAKACSTGYKLASSSFFSSDLENRWFVHRIN